MSNLLYSRGDQQFGPFTAQRLKQLAAEGTLLQSDLVWREGTTNKVQAVQVRGLAFNGSTSVPVAPPLAADGLQAPQFRQVDAAPPTTPPLIPNQTPQVSRSKSQLRHRDNESGVADGWHYAHDGKQTGPVSSVELRCLAASHQLQLTDLVWKDGMTTWAPASKVKGLFPQAAPTTSPVPPPLVPSATQKSSEESFPQHLGFPPPLPMEPTWDSVVDILPTIAVAPSNPFQSAAPPRLPASAVPNGIIWTLAFAPIIGMLCKHVFGTALSIDPASLWFITVGINVTLCTIDFYHLKNYGIDTKAFGGWIILVPVYLFKRAKALGQPLSYFVTWIICFILSLLAR